ncbi:MAG: tRNA lysidine(34) synthetase TilS [Desulfarculus sp.]|nr:tRNA lysidine(34) synthetase TilS [Desulfarculus sp.]
MSLVPPPAGVKPGLALGLCRQVLGLAPGPGNILAAVSGGGDSVALLRLLHHLAPGLGWLLTVAHVDHGLRPDSADDASFVRGLAASLGLPCLERRVAVRVQGRSPEEAARLARRAALLEMATEAGAGVIALAHSLDDQAETVLARALTGSGPSGLAGMRPLGLPWWRPLLAASRQDLRDYLRGLGQAWRSDPSNQGLEPLRNRVRQQLLPLTRQAINPRADQALGRLAHICAQEEDFWVWWCGQQWTAAGRAQGDSLCLELGFLEGLPMAAQGRLVRFLAGRLTGAGQHLLSLHVAQVLDLLGGPPGRRLTLPGGLEAAREHGCLRLYWAGPPADFQAQMHGPGWLWLPHLRGWLQVEECPGPPLLAARGPEAWLPAKAVAWPLMVRPPRRGEVFHPLGAPGKKRLGRVLLDRKVPAWWRPRTVMVEDQEGLWWAAPWSLADRARQNRSSGPWLRLCLVDTIDPPAYTRFFKNAPLNKGLDGAATGKAVKPGDDP